MEYSVRVAGIGDSVRIFDLISGAQKEFFRREYGAAGFDVFRATGLSLGRISEDLINASRDRVFFVALSSGVVVGVIGAVTKGADMGKLITLAVEVNFPFKEIASLLLDAMSAYQHERGNTFQLVEIYEDDKDRYDFYRDNNFKEVNRHSRQAGAGRILTSIILKREL